jgi:Rad3-related DNA helicase
MRHADDWCEIYILDKQFLRFYRRNGRLFPRWWKDALDMHFDPRQLG